MFQKLLELTVEAAKYQALAEERAAYQQETKSQEIVTTERFATVTATTQNFTRELLISHTQNVNGRTDNLNNATHVSVEAEESPGNSGSHRQMPRQTHGYTRLLTFDNRGLFSLACKFMSMAR